MADDTNPIRAHVRSRLAMIPTTPDPSGASNAESRVEAAFAEFDRWSVSRSTVDQDRRASAQPQVVEEEGFRTGVDFRDLEMTCIERADMPEEISSGTLRNAARAIAHLRRERDDTLRTHKGETAEREGWVLVPCEPTEDMIFAQTGLRPGAYRYDAIAAKAAETYQTMLAASPAAPQDMEDGR